jgi:hypothetical protein
MTENKELREYGIKKMQQKIRYAMTQLGIRRTQEQMRGERRRSPAPVVNS